MSKLIYGRNGHVRFSNEAEKREAFEYLRKSPNVVRVHEDNDEQGAWGPEERIHFKTLVGVPEGLLKNMTKGRGSVAGRINCKELIEEVWGLAPTARPSSSRAGSHRRASGMSTRSTSSRPTASEAVGASLGGLCCQIRAPRGSECMVCGRAVR